MRENPESDFGELGKKWINWRLRELREFRSIFSKHLSEHVYKCFELHSEPNLKAVINEEKCQRTIFDTLEYFVCEKTPRLAFKN